MDSPNWQGSIWNSPKKQLFLIYGFANWRNSWWNSPIGEIRGEIRQLAKLLLAKTGIGDGILHQMSTPWHDRWALCRAWLTIVTDTEIVTQYIWPSSVIYIVYKTRWLGRDEKDLFMSVHWFKSICIWVTVIISCSIFWSHRDCAKSFCKFNSDWLYNSKAHNSVAL